MAGLLKNRFIYQSDRLDYSRSLFNYEKRHSTNLLSGMITPVHTEFVYPGTSPDLRFGTVIESAPIISTCLDNIYVDIISIWCPARLVMEEWNEFLGESHTTAFTINRNITIPKIGTIYTDRDYPMYDNQNLTYYTKAFLADNYLAPHIGYRLFGLMLNHQFIPHGGNAINIPSDSLFYDGVSILQSRVYDLNWNTFFRNENVQAPILVNKTATVSGRDLDYQYGLGELHLANKLKSWFTDLTPAPSLLDVSIGLGDLLPVITGANHLSSLGTEVLRMANPINGTIPVNGGSLGVSGGLVGFITNTSDYTENYATPANLYADTASLTVNKMYYALMEQRFANKMMKGRRAVEFYANFFGVNDSDAGHDLPKLLVQKRFPLNISQVIATASGTNGSETTDLGQRGAFSTTGFGDTLIKNFTASEHGFIQTYMVIRGQQSISGGIDKQLGYSKLLDTYIPEFDHIGPVGVETLEVGNPVANSTYIGYKNAWYAEREPVSDVVGIMSPGEPLSYKTLAPDFTPTGVVSDWWLKHWPSIIDRIFLFPVCNVDVSPSSAKASIYGEPFDSNRYQFLTQFVVKGKEAKVMSPDSEPLKLRL